MNWHTFFFLLFSLFACGFALAVVFTSNIVRMAFYLVLSLGSTAGLFFLAGSDFIGAMQLLIYVGGTLVLLVFGVMLTAQSPFINMKTPSGDWVLAALVGGALLAVLVVNAVSLPEWRAAPAKEAAMDVAPTGTAVGQGLLGLRVDALSPPKAEISGLAGYMLPFEIVSVHLLVVLIGAAYLARAKRRSRPREFEVATQSAKETDMNLLTEPVGISHYLVVGAILFVCGAICMATKRNALGVLMGIELVLNGANINFIAFGSSVLKKDGGVSIGLDGQLIALFVIVLAAAEAAVALAITLNFYNNHSTVDVDRADDLKG